MGIFTAYYFWLVQNKILKDVHGESLLTQNARER